MKLTNQQIENLINVEIPLIQNQKTSFKLKFYLNRLTNLIQSSYDTYSKIKYEIISKYGVSDQEGNISVPVGTYEFSKVIEELDPISKYEIDIDFTIPLSLFDDIQIDQSCPGLFLLIEM